MARRMSRGEIWTYAFRHPDKKRPVLILMRNSTIEVSGTVLVAPITSTIRSIPTEVLVGEDEGLKHVSAVKLDNVQSIDKGRLERFIGTLSDSKMSDVCRALGIATGCT
jgi:mRNA interferase MazF